MFLQTKTKKDMSKIEQLSEIIDSIYASRDIRELLQASLNQTLKALYSERGSIFMAGEDGEELSLKCANDNELKLDQVRRKLGEGVVGKVAKEKRSLLVKDIRQDRVLTISNINHDYRTNSFLCVPILAGAKLIGVISITENNTGKPYSEEDLKFLEIVAGSIGLQIEKSKLLCEVEKIKKKAETDGRFTELGKFSSGISHELNNPLDGVVRYINLALNTIEEGPARGYLMEAKSGLIRIVNIVRSLLELSRRNKNLNPKMASVNDTLEHSIELAMNCVAHKTVDIKKNLHKDLPMIPDMGLESIFSNILKNAVDALGETGSIEVKTARNNGFIEISISDTGCGMPQEHINRIFEPFFTTKEMSKGVGLGLAICDDIVKRYNGRIQVSSQMDKGTAFVIQLPCKDNA
jgi:K+-sensing histidine kinase KdpD